MRIIHEDCDPTISEDKTLPTNAFLVEYINGETTHYDVVISGKKVDIFDSYWDKYKKNLINITQAAGTSNPKLWGSKPPENKKKR
jgi:hypothetical protein